jgi:hypothetical protein
LTSGAAKGVDRQYQEQCRDVLVHRDSDLKPYASDGIDVPFEAGGTTWTMDVALRKSSGNVVVAECRRTEATVKQEDVAAFAYKVEQLRKALRVEVAGAFLTKTGVQLGAVKVGGFEGISIAVLAEGEKPPGFTIEFHRYDADRERRLKDLVIHVPPARVTITAHPPRIFVRRKDGTESSS